MLITLTDDQRTSLGDDLLQRFLRYVQIDSTAVKANPTSTDPSSPGQIEMLRLLKRELSGLPGLSDIEIAGRYLYATLPASPGAVGPPIGLLAHVDTSYEVSGKGVKPVVIREYDGSEIRFPDNPDLVLSPDDSDCPVLREFKGKTIITASGTTNLGADDKCGVADIMALVKFLLEHPEWPHPELRLVFTTDEEIGHGVEHIDYSRLPKYCYTVDGAGPGEIECESFDASEATLVFNGRVFHPGQQGYKRLVNAAVAAARFATLLPATEAPESTTGWDGFFYVTDISGTCAEAKITLIMRDFTEAALARRAEVLTRIKDTVLATTPDLAVELTIKPQYSNMRRYVDQHPASMELLRAAVIDAELTPKEIPIRGGTDGCALSKNGHPCPNIFAGEFNFHSLTEFAVLEVMVSAVETMLHLCRRWAEHEAAA
ncbi:MAG: peptidase T [Proteobacteria bacterium]|nr:MAG: peptidase T [Pseudomonadota bacterium]